MYVACHRCGEGLNPGGDSTFCPNCGAPQIYLLEQDRPELPEGQTTGTLPPPRPKTVEWKTAIRCAAGVAAVAAALSLLAVAVPAATPLNWLWMVSGSLTVLAFYQRRRPKARMDARIGARIGVMTGVVLVSFVTAAMAVAGLVARFALHRMAGFDAALAEQMHAQIAHAAATNPIPPELLRYLYSPEFGAGMMLAGIAMIAAVVMVLSTLGGAVGGMLRARPGQAA